MIDLAALKDKYRRDDEEFEFTISGGEVFRALRPADASVKVKIEKFAAKAIKLAAMGGTAEWKPFLPAEAEVISAAAYIEALLVSPKMSFVDALEIAKTCGDLIVEISSPLVASANKAAIEGEVEIVDEAKNASSETVTGEPS